MFKLIKLENVYCFLNVCDGEKPKLFKCSVVQIYFFIHNRKAAEHEIIKKTKNKHKIICNGQMKIKRIQNNQMAILVMLFILILTFSYEMIYF